MAIPYLKINSVTYSTNVVTVNTSYQYCRGGGSVSIVGLPQPLYYGVTASYLNNQVVTFSLALSASTAYNLTFSFFKGPYLNYPLDTPSLTGVTGATTYAMGGYAYNIGFQSINGLTTSYELHRNFYFTLNT